MATSLAASISPPAQVGQRIVIVGVTGAGKTTLADQLAELCGLPHVELDALHWEPNWTPAPSHVLRERVTRALSGGAWVVDGNYSQVRDLIWPRADTIIWLDYPLPLILWRLLRRTIWRITRHPELWNGNRETWRGTFFSWDSLFFWALKTHKRRRKEYPALFAQPEFAHLTAVRFRSPRATERWLATLESQRAGDQAPSGRA